MAEQQMRYRFARAFIVEGLMATEGQEIVLSDQPDKGRKFMLTGSPDSLLGDADKSAAAGCFGSDKDLKTVTRLLSDSLLTQDNKLRGFLAASPDCPQNPPG